MNNCSSGPSMLKLESTASFAGTNNANEPLKLTVWTYGFQKGYGVTVFRYVTVNRFCCLKKIRKLACLTPHKSHLVDEQIVHAIKQIKLKAQLKLEL